MTSHDHIHVHVGKNTSEPIAVITTPSLLHCTTHNTIQYHHSSLSLSLHHSLTPSPTLSTNITSLLHSSISECLVAIVGPRAHQEPVLPLPPQQRRLKRTLHKQNPIKKKLNHWFLSIKNDTTTNIWYGWVSEWESGGEGGCGSGCALPHASDGSARESLHAKTHHHDCCSCDKSNNKWMSKQVSKWMLWVSEWVSGWVVRTMLASQHPTS